MSLLVQVYHRMDAGEGAKEISDPGTFSRAEAYILRGIVYGPGQDPVDRQIRSYDNISVVKSIQGDKINAT